MPQRAPDRACRGARRLPALRSLRSDCDLRRLYNPPLKPGVEPALGQGWKWLAPRLVTPAVAEIGNPGRTAASSKEADQVGRLRGRGRDDAVELSSSEQSASCRDERR